MLDYNTPNPRLIVLNDWIEQLFFTKYMQYVYVLGKCS